MPQTKKIQGKFYPLKSEEWLDSINQLTHSELKILYYIRSLDPYSNGINLTPAQIARDLATEKHKMHRSTVGRALKSLDRKGFINMELLQVRIKVNPKGFLSETEPVKTENNVVATQQCCDHTTQVVTTQHDVSPHNTSCDHTTQVVTTQQLSSETKSEHSFQNPKNIKTYSDFKKTLSEDERENFLNYVEEAIRNLENPINDLEAWLASKNAAEQNRWEVYYQNYQQQKTKQKPRNSQQNQGSDDLSPEKKKAIAEFRKRMKLGQQVNESEPKDTNSEEYQQQKAAFDELLSSPPERREKSLAQLRREAITEAQRKQEELDRQRKEAAAERAKQLDQDYEQRKAEMLRQIEELSQRQQQQNTEINSKNPEHE